ncbi:UDP-2,3-diacylglucosamine diphosphatase [Burkholderiaceae bacterium DAT-1]|nr:UDP-2,3-diacylglucosamine diphosphatase [Burkholderiaceae bacterium DAT-1]
MPMNKPTLLISDLHLREDDPDTLKLFLSFLREEATQAEALYLLGDIFEYWAGDDDESALNITVCAALATLAKSGTQLFLLHGNRDFLLGEAFAARAQVTILPDPSIVNLAGHTCLLSHGDMLCTDDAAYQQFRSTVRQPHWQTAFLNRPLADRLAEVARIRAASKAANATKASDIMDVNADAVAKLFADQPCTILIHGHTHRPARHMLEVTGVQRERWVLPDWDDGAGGYGRIDTHAISMHPLGERNIKSSPEWCINATIQG